MTFIDSLQSYYIQPKIRMGSSDQSRCRYELRSFHMDE